MYRRVQVTARRAERRNPHKLAVLAAVAAVAAFEPAMAWAEEAARQLPETVVSASRIPVLSEAVGSAVTVITAEELERRQVRVVSDVLRDVPGLAVSRSGGVGTFTQVRIRGAEANQTLVIIDGVEVNNPAGGSEFDLATLLANDIERIEVLRGPQSALYGSDAIGGVINIITKKGPGRGVEVGASGEYGSFNSYQVSGNAKVGFADVISAALSVARLETDGISAADEDNGNHENDGAENLTINAKVNIKPTDFLELEFSGRRVDSTTEFDGFVGGIGAVDADRTTESEQTYGKAEAKLTLFDGIWEHIGRATYTREFDENFSNDVETSESKGRKVKVGYQTNVIFETPLLGDFFETEDVVEAAHALTFAVERENDSVVSTSAFTNVDREVETTSYIGEYRLDLFERLFLSGSVRHDDNDKLFDDTTTFRTTAAYLHEETGTRLHGSYGTGVKNPTIFELFGFAANFVGNPNLDPERSRGWDVGVEQSFFGGDVLVDATYFDNRIEDLILGAGNTAINLDGTTEIHGVELTGRAEVLPGLSLLGAYTYTMTEDPQGNDLVRRAKHIASANANYAFEVFDRRGNVNFGVDYNGPQKDFAFDAAFNRSIVDLDGYLLLNASADFEVLPGVAVFARGENLLNQDYQEVLSFGTPGIAVYAGVRAKLGPYQFED